MPPKRRKASVDRDDDPSPTSTPPTKRRKKSALNYDPMEFCQELYDTIRNHKHEDGRLLCESFIRVPKRRTDPEYYDIVTQPIDLLKIQHKLRNEEYEEIEQLTQDIELMVNNAKAFYSERDRETTSQEYQDACDLWDLYEDTKNLLMAEVFGETEKSADTESITMETDKEKRTRTVYQDDRSSVMTEENTETDPILEEMFSTVVTAKDGARKVSEMFTVLPSKTRYPEYYEVTKEPIDIRTIAQRIQSNSYPSLDDLVADFMLMISNAKSFNEPGSKIYKDANMLKKIINSKKIELDSRSGRKTSARVRNRRSMHEVKKLSAEIAALEVEDVAEAPPPKTPASSRRGRKIKMAISADEASSDSDTENDEENDEEDEVDEEEGSSDDENEEGGYKGNKGLYYELFNAVKACKVEGRSAIDPFVRLPNRRFFPAYYEEIKRPMSVSNISKKLKTNSYSSIERMIADFDLVFNNAQQSSLANTKYKDARKLQAFLHQKVEELKRDHPEELENNSAIDIRATPITKHARASMEPGSDGEGTPRDRLKPGRKPLSPEEALTKRLNLIFDYIYNFEVDGRELILIFLEIPPKKMYPDYYQVIAKPIDMGMIEAKIKNKQYGSEHTLLQDFELMFSNAKHYNEEGSRVYKDAVTLEKALKKKLQSLKPIGDSPFRTGKPGRPRGKSSVNGGSPLGQKLQELYTTILEYKDSRGRGLSSPFVVLPSKSDYPDYYDVIKKPIDMERIRGQMNQHKYGSVEDMVQDFLLMFDNACKYNETGSLIYKDALTLQRVCLEKKQELVLDDGSDVPDVRAAVQEIMTSLYVATFNHTDEDARCYSDSFQDMPIPPKAANGETDSSLKKATFEIVKKNLDKGRYRRMDRFQEDMFEVFKYARDVSRTDSQLYEDSADLQKFFIQTREQLCKNGEALLTPALSYQEVHLLRDLEIERREKLPQEMKEDEEKKKQQAEEDAKKEEQQGMDVNESPKEGKLETIDHKGETYRVGDFVFVEPRKKRGRPSLREKDTEPHIVCIERMWREENGEELLYGCWLYRPQETYHAASRKFLEKEVFKSDFYEAATFSRVLGKCFVMPVKDYYKMKPEGFDEKQVFVCESRYNSKHKAFKKMKIWQMPKNETVRIMPRDVPLVPNRVASVFKQKQTAVHSETSDDDGDTQIIEKVRENVPIIERRREEGQAETEDQGYTYYEQCKTPAGWLKLGDCVYVRSDEDRPYIALIEKLWMDKDGDMYFHGPWYVHPSDVDHAPNRLFYKNEVFKSSIEDTNPVLSIQGRCAVMTFKDYCISRPTEVPEIDVYVSECKYVESEKLIRKITKTVPKRPYNSLKVLDDEVIFFKKSISPQKEMSPLALQSDDLFSEATDDVSMSGTNVSITEGFPSFGIGEAFNQDDSNFSSASQPQKSEKKKIYYYKDRQRKFVDYFWLDTKSGKAWQPSGYMVYSSENRKRISDENPDLTFGEISRAVGQKWRELNKDDKNRYEEKAKKLAEENAAKQAEAERAFNDSLSMFPPSGSPMMDRSMSPGMSGRQGTPGTHHFASQQGYMQPNAYPVQHYGNQYHQGGAPPPQPYYPQHHMGGVPGVPPPHGRMGGPPGAPYPPGPVPPHQHMAPQHHNTGMMSPHAGSAGTAQRPNYQQQQLPAGQQIQFAQQQPGMGASPVRAPSQHAAAPGRPGIPPQHPSGMNSTSGQGHLSGLAGPSDVEKTTVSILLKGQPQNLLHQPRPTKRLVLKPARYREFESFVSKRKHGRGKSEPASVIVQRPYVLTAGNDSPCPSIGRPAAFKQINRAFQAVQRKRSGTAKFIKDKFGSLRSNTFEVGESPFEATTQSPSVATPPLNVRRVSSVVEQGRTSTPVSVALMEQCGYWGYSQTEPHVPQNYFCMPQNSCAPGYPQSQGLGLFPSTDGITAPMPHSVVSSQEFRPRMQPAAQAPQVPQRPPSPMFVSVPPRTQRLLHSEAYLRYIEGLHPDNPNISNWERQLTATKENTPLDKNAKLPTQWLANGSGHHENTVSALWALRDLMTKDALMVSRTLEFSQL